MHVTSRQKVSLPGAGTVSQAAQGLAESGAESPAEFTLSQPGRPWLLQVPLPGPRACPPTRVRQSEAVANTVCAS